MPLAMSATNPRKRSRSASALTGQEHARVQQDIEARKTARALSVFDRVKTRGCCGRKCISTVPREFAEKHITSFSRLTFPERRLVLHTVRCSVLDQKGPYCLRGLGKPLCRVALTATIGVKKKMWDLVKCGDKDEQFVLGSPPSHEAIGERNHGSFEAYGGVEVLDQIIYEIAEDFCVYSPGRYALYVSMSQTISLSNSGMFGKDIGRGTIQIQFIYPRRAIKPNCGACSRRDAPLSTISVSTFFACSDSYQHLFFPLMLQFLRMKMLILILILIVSAHPTMNNFDTGRIPTFASR